MLDATTALNRFGLGARGADPAPADPRGWLLDQLQRFDPAPAPIRALPETSTLITMLRDARDNRQDRKQEAKANGTDPKAKGDGMPAPFRELREAYLTAVAARVDVAVSSETPFIERLVHFWANHFAVSVDKVATVGMAGDLEFKAIRPHVLGKFGTMLSAVERHPAMLLYLDQAQSVGPGSMLGQIAARRGRERGLNENLAREILELHTLGVRTGYSQADVTEFARALTGWTLGGLAKQPILQGPGPQFWFAAPIHQPGTRQVLGKPYRQNGEDQAQAILDDLARHPMTARHIATKLARHFAADDPPPALIARIEQAFLSSDGDLPTLYRVLIDAPECQVPAAKFRSPWDWSLAALRATGIGALPGRPAAGMLTELGQAVWKPGSPAGYDDTGPSWAGPDALLRRVELAQRLAQRSVAIDARALGDRLFPGALSTATRQAVERAEDGRQALALLLASPEMMRR